MTTPTVVIGGYKVASFPEIGGHFWVYMQYALGLRQLGCDVWWMERFIRGTNDHRDAAAISTFFDRMEEFGFGGRALLIAARDRHVPWADSILVGPSLSEACALMRRTDLLLNFHYAIEPDLLGRFRKTALLDIY